MCVRRQGLEQLGVYRRSNRNGVFGVPSCIGKQHRGEAQPRRGARQGWCWLRSSLQLPSTNDIPPECQTGDIPPECQTSVSVLHILQQDKAVNLSLPPHLPAKNKVVDRSKGQDEGRNFVPLQPSCKLFKSRLPGEDYNVESYFSLNIPNGRLAGVLFGYFRQKHSYRRSCKQTNPLSAGPPT